MGEHFLQTDAADCSVQRTTENRELICGTAVLPVANPVQAVCWTSAPYAHDQQMPQHRRSCHQSKKKCCPYGYVTCLQQLFIRLRHHGATHLRLAASRGS